MSGKNVNGGSIITKGSHISRILPNRPEFISEVSIGDKFVSVRIEDSNNSEFWMETNIPVETIQKLLAEAGYKPAVGL